jgi:hypothetical protein
MEILTSKLLNSVEDLNSLLSMSLNLVTSIKLAKATKEIDSYLGIVNEKRNSLIKELGTEDEGGNFSVKPEKMVEFNKQWLPVVSSVVKIDVEPISVAELKDRDGKDINIKPITLINLDFLIDFKS